MRFDYKKKQPDDTWSRYLAFWGGDVEFLTETGKIRQFAANGMMTLTMSAILKTDWILYDWMADTDIGYGYNIPAYLVYRWLGYRADAFERNGYNDIEAAELSATIKYLTPYRNKAQQRKDTIVALLKILLQMAFWRYWGWLPAPLDEYGNFDWSYRKPEEIRIAKDYATKTMYVALQKLGLAQKNSITAKAELEEYLK